MSHCIELQVRSDMVGGILGKGGKRMKALQKAFNISYKLNMTIEKIHSVDYQDFTIRGERGDCEAVRDILVADILAFDKINKMSESETKREVTLSSSPSEAPEDKEIIKREIVVPKRLVGLVVGLNGSRTIMIQEEYNVAITLHVERNYADAVGDWAVFQAKGRRKACEEVQKIILASVCREATTDEIEAREEYREFLGRQSQRTSNESQAAVATLDRNLLKYQASDPQMLEREDTSRAGPGLPFYSPPFPDSSEIVYVDVCNHKNLAPFRNLVLGARGAKVLTIVEDLGGKRKVRIQMRGSGSGFLEGPESREIDEPLHLHVSSVPEVLETAVARVRELVRFAKAKLPFDESVLSSDYVRGEPRDRERERGWDGERGWDRDRERDRDWMFRRSDSKDRDGGRERSGRGDSRSRSNSRDRRDERLPPRSRGEAESFEFREGNHRPYYSSTARPRLPFRVRPLEGSLLSICVSFSVIDNGKVVLFLKGFSPNDLEAKFKCTIKKMKKAEKDEIGLDSGYAIQIVGRAEDCEACQMAVEEQLMHHLDTYHADALETTSTRKRKLEDIDAYAVPPPRNLSAESIPVVPVPVPIPVPLSLPVHIIVPSEAPIDPLADPRRRRLIEKQHTVPAEGPPSSAPAPAPVAAPAPAPAPAVVNDDADEWDAYFDE